MVSLKVADHQFHTIVVPMMLVAKVPRQVVVVKESKDSAQQNREDYILRRQEPSLGSEEIEYEEVRRPQADA